MHVHRRVAAGAAAVVLAGTVGVTAAAPASAGSSYAQLFISPSSEHAGYYVVVVSGHVHTSSPVTVGMRLIGDDPVFNDDLGVSRTTTAVDGEFAMEALVWHGTLDEDWEGRDEVFAKVSASNGWSTSTRNVTGYF